MAAGRDAEMHSSPSSSLEVEDEADLFPGSNNRPSNPLIQNDHLNAAAPGELSPPRSQASEEPEPPTNAAMVDDEPNGQSVMGFHEERGQGNNNNTDEARGSEPAKPGSGWNNKRAQEEFNRAYDNALDKDFTLRDFGDVMIADGQQGRG